MVDNTPSNRKRRSWYEGTPTRIPMSKISQNITYEPCEEIEVNGLLNLTAFSSRPCIDFGSVMVGESGTARLAINNPHDYDQTLVCEKCPSELKLSTNEITVSGNKQLLLDLIWQPINEGLIRHMMLFRVDKVYRLQVCVVGECVTQRAKKRHRKAWATTKSLTTKIISKEDIENDNTSLSCTARDNFEISYLEESKLTVAIDQHSSPNQSIECAASPLSSILAELSNSAFKTPTRRNLMNVPTPSRTFGTSSKLASVIEEAGSAVIYKPLSPLSAITAIAQICPSVDVNPLRTTKAVVTFTAASSNDCDAVDSLNPVNVTVDLPNRNVRTAAVKRRMTDFPVLEQMKPIKRRIIADREPSSSAQQFKKAPRNLRLSHLNSSEPRKNDMSLMEANVDHTPTRAVRHPMPFASNNLFFDDRWIEKQTFGFTQWLNFVFTSSLEATSSLSTGDKETWPLAASQLCILEDDAKFKLKQLQPTEAPSRETASFRAYSNVRALNKLRRAACDFFAQDSMSESVRRLERAVDEARLFRMREDLSLRADRGARLSLLRLLLSYNPLWLRIGLETTTGEVILSTDDSCGGSSQMLDRSALVRFLLTRILWNDSLAKRYALSTVVKLFRPGFEERLGSYIIKKVLTLIYFLDRAKKERLIDFDPCLFERSSPHKSSRELLLEIARGFLSGVGDLARLMSNLGCRVCVVQTALEEYELRVSDLAGDLRDGVRLCRLAERLTGKALTVPVRCPAISRLQKLHNVQIALTCLNFDLNKDGLDVRYIVDGHRERTLHVLWKLVMMFGFGNLLNLKALELETIAVKKNLPKDCLPPNINFGACDERLRPLLAWCQAVCSHFKLPVDNLTVAFSDGRAFCMLLHYYQPYLLRFEEVRWRTLAVLSRPDDENQTVVTPTRHTTKQLIENELFNLRLAIERTAELGGIPPLLQPHDFSNCIPDERVVASFLCYLCARLLDLRSETSAATIIQRAWRSLKAKRLFSRQTSAAVLIQRVWRLWHSSCLLAKKLHLERQTASVSVIQRQWRLHRRRLLFKSLQKVCFLLVDTARRQIAASNVIQSTWRIYRRNMLFRTLAKACQCDYVKSEYAKRIQTCWRSHRRRVLLVSLHKGCRIAVETQHRRIKAACSIQACWRSHRRRVLLEALRQCCHTVVETEHQRIKAASYIQACWRSHRRQILLVSLLKGCSIAVETQHKIIKAACSIQACWRSHRRQILLVSLLKGCRIAVETQHRRIKAACSIQACWRSHRRRVLLEALRQCCHTVVETEHQRIKAASYIQTCWRSHRRQILLEALRQCCHIVVETEQKRIKAASYIQTCWRSHRRQILMVTLLKGCRIAVETQHKRINAASYIQTCWRSHRRRVLLEALRQCCHTVVETEHQRIKAASYIQTFWRSHRRQILLEALRQGCRIALGTHHRRTEATNRIQKNWKLHRRHLLLDSLRKGCRIVVETEHKRIKAASLIQACWRSHRRRILLNALRQGCCIVVETQRRKIEAANRIQICWRSYRRQAFLNFLRKACRIVVETEHRRINAASSIQTFWKSHRRRRAAVRLQAAWRAFLVRRSEIGILASDLRKRLSFNALNASQNPEQRLGNRAKTALGELKSLVDLTGKSQIRLSNIAISALQQLASTTRLSPELCQVVTEAGIVDLLLRLLAECNRSVPALKVSAACVAVLFNLARHAASLKHLLRVHGQYLGGRLVEVLQAAIAGAAAAPGTSHSGSLAPTLFSEAACLLGILLQTGLRLETRAAERALAFRETLARRAEYDLKRRLLHAKASGAFVFGLQPEWALHGTTFHPEPLIAANFMAEHLIRPHTSDGQS